VKIYPDIKGDQIQCPGCWEMLEWDGRDLTIDPKYDDMYYMECPVCHERMYVKRNTELDNMYNESH
jgi:hypothetical protein